MFWTYITKQGDTWDVLARDIYGTEMLAYALQQANPYYLFLLYFPAGLQLKVPETPASATAAPPPPWERRSLDSTEELNPVGKIILDYSAFINSGTNDHNTLKNRNKEEQHLTSAIRHGKRQLDEVIEDLIVAVEEAGDRHLFADPNTGSVYVKDPK